MNDSCRRTTLVDISDDLAVVENQLLHGVPKRQRNHGQVHASGSKGGDCKQQRRRYRQDDTANQREQRIKVLVVDEVGSECRSHAGNCVLT